ncbi:MAG: hypothetical protein ACLFSB_10690 [Chitinispirillaceae bacterium]
MIVLFCLPIVQINQFNQRYSMDAYSSLDSIKQSLGITPPDSRERSPIAVVWDSVFQRVAQAGGWELKTGSAYFEKPAIMGTEWELYKRSTQVVVEVYSTESLDESVDFMVYLASQTTMMEIPFRQSDTPVGDYTLMPRTGPMDKLYWTYGNICFVFTLNDGNADLTSLASMVQKVIKQTDTMETFLSPIQIADRDSMKKSIVVEETLKITLEKMEGEEHFMIDAFSLRGNMRVLSTGIDGIVVKGIKKGNDTIAIVKGDPVTLRSVQAHCEITVTD